MKLEALALTLLLGCSAVHAQTLNLVSGDDYLPYADRKAPEGGMATDIVRKAFAAVKTEVKVDWLPWGRGYDDTRAGSFTATFPYFKGAEREKEMLYSDVMVKLTDRVFIKAGARKYNFAQLPGFAGSTLCSPLGWTLPDKLAPLIKAGQIKVQSPKDITACVKLLDAERADFFVTEQANGLATIAASGVAAGAVALADVPPFAENGLYLLASKNVPASKDVIASFNKGLDAIRKNGTYDAIVKAHSK